MFSFFFFQAEDGIRDHCVTGVQTCALPIFDVAAKTAVTNLGGSGISREREERDKACDKNTRHRILPERGSLGTVNRSEERRVGKECRSRWSPHQEKKKNEQGNETKE